MMKSRRKLIIFTFFLILLSSTPINPLPLKTVAASGANWLEGWDDRKEITVLGSTDGAQTNFPILLHIHYGSGSDGSNDVYLGSKSQKDFDDLRFTDDDGDTRLDYWIQNFTRSTDAQVWVEIPSLSASPSTATIYSYYGNTTVTTTSSIADTFAVGDDFNVWIRDGAVLRGSDFGGENVGENNIIYEGSPQILTSAAQVFKCWTHVAQDVGGTTYHQVWYMESLDAYTWNISASPIVNVTTTQRPDVLKTGSTYYMYVQSATNQTSFRRLSSANGETGWTVDKGNVLSIGGGGSWDDKYLGNIWVTHNDTSGIWRMLYDASDVATNRWDIGMAQSVDGLTWVKNGSNPVISGGAGMSGGLEAHWINNTWWAWFHKAGSGNVPTDITRGYSNDLVSWTIFSGYTFRRSTADEGFDVATGQVADPTFAEVNGTVYMLYNALPDQTFDPDDTSTQLARYPGTFLELIASNEDNLDTTLWAGDTGSVTIHGDFARIIGGATTEKYVDTTKNATVYSKVYFNAKFDGRGVVGANLGGFIAARYLTSGIVRIYYYKDATQTKIYYSDGVNAQVDVSNPNTAWNRYRMDWEPTQVAYFMDEVEMTNSPLSGLGMPTIDLPLRFSSIGPVAYATRVDYCFSRLFVSDEPSISAWGSEESAPLPSANNAPTVTSFLILDLTGGDILYKTIWYRPQMIVDDADGFAEIDWAMWAFETDRGWHNVSYDAQADVWDKEAGGSRFRIQDGYIENSGTQLSVYFYFKAEESMDVKKDVDVYTFVNDTSGAGPGWALTENNYFEILDWEDEPSGGGASTTPSGDPAEEPPEDWIDTDGDGIPDWDDDDMDGDWVPDDFDPDIDGDGIPNEEDSDPRVPEIIFPIKYLISIKTPSGRIINLIPLYTLKIFQTYTVPFVLIIMLLLLVIIYYRRKENEGAKKSLKKPISTDLYERLGKLRR